LTILDNVGGRLWVKSRLTGISINLEASQKELEGYEKWCCGELPRGALAVV
jgi:hypothetical protein